MSHLLARLISAGTPADLVAEVAKELARAELAQEALETRRSKDRERQAKHRSSHDVTECHVTERDVTDQKALDKKPPHTPQKINPKKSPPISPPSWVPAVEWAAFEEMRQRIRKPLTDRARELAIGELAKLREAGHAPADVLNWAVMNSYQGLFPPPANRARAGPEPVIGI